MRVRALVKGYWLVADVVGCHNGKLVCYLVDTGEYVAAERFRNLQNKDRSL